MPRCELKLYCIVVLWIFYDLILASELTASDKILIQTIVPLILSKRISEY